jgi:hypothetical protein
LSCPHFERISILSFSVALNHHVSEHFSAQFPVSINTITDSAIFCRINSCVSELAGYPGHLLWGRWVGDDFHDPVNSSAALWSYDMLLAHHRIRGDSWDNEAILAMLGAAKFRETGGLPRQVLFFFLVSQGLLSLSVQGLPPPPSPCSSQMHGFEDPFTFLVQPLPH